MKVSVSSRQRRGTSAGSETGGNNVGLWISGGSVALPSGYSRLSESPEVQACVGLVPCSEACSLQITAAGRISGSASAQIFYYFGGV